MIFGKRYILYFTALIVTILFFAFNYSEDEKNQMAFKDQYKIHSIQLPSSITFANEVINLDEMDLQERLDRELLTNVYWQSQTLLFIKRAHKYFPVIEKILKEQSIPDDFKYLCVAESGLQYQVVSPSNAAGYWQFLEGTGKRYGLLINEEIDERFHLEKSTIAACKYFKEAYNEFKSWPLVAASYNMGIDGVRKQLLMQKVTTFNDLYLNNETARYLFRISAIKTILENPTAYGFYVPFEQLYKPQVCFRIKITQPITDIAQFALDNKTTYKQIKLHNPWLRRNTFTPIDSTFFISLPIAVLDKNSYKSQVINDTISLDQLK